MYKPTYVLPSPQNPANPQHMSHGGKNLLLRTSYFIFHRAKWHEPWVNGFATFFRPTILLSPYFVWEEYLSQQELVEVHERSQLGTL